VLRGFGIGVPRLQFGVEGSWWKCQLETLCPGTLARVSGSVFGVCTSGFEVWGCMGG
jgi:hypothetical protein